MHANRYSNHINKIKDQLVVNPENVSTVIGLPNNVEMFVQRDASPDGLKKMKRNVEQRIEDEKAKTSRERSIIGSGITKSHRYRRRD